MVVVVGLRRLMRPTFWRFGGVSECGGMATMIVEGMGISSSYDI